MHYLPPFEEKLRTQVRNAMAMTPLITCGRSLCDTNMPVLASPLECAAFADPAPTKDCPKMSLSFTGDVLKTINTANYRAIGSHGELIIVEASHEAVQDYGEAAVQQKASSKYDEAQVLNNIITVKTSDFR